MDTFKAEENNIFKLFVGNSDETKFEIPSYQRPYSWGKEEVEQFCEDIKESFEEKTPFLMGSIILIEDEKEDDKYEVVDGQQRLTTISIFLSVLKNFIENKKDVMKLFLLENKKGDMEAKVIRVSTAKKHYKDFEFVLKKFDYKDIKNKLKEDKKNNFYLNSIYIFEKLNEYNKEKDFNIENLFLFFKKHIQIIKVSTCEKNVAFKLFEVLNSRGLPLKNSDLIKNDLIDNLNKFYGEDLSSGKENSFIEEWKNKEDGMKNLNEDIEDLFTYYIYFKLGKNPKRNLFVEFKEIYKSFKTFENFNSEFEKFYDFYISLYDFEKNNYINYKKINLMKYLPNGRFWKSILLTYLMKNGNQKDENFNTLTKFLFKFYYLNFFGRQTINPHKQLSFDIIKSMKNEKFEILLRKKIIYEKFNGKDFNINELEEIGNTYFEKEIGGINEKLRKELNEDVYNEKFCKSLIMILEAFTSNEEDKLIDLFENETNIEHIYPRNSKKENKNEDLENIKNNLGNLTLLLGNTNKKFSNKTFEEKKELLKTEYKGNNKFNLSKKVFDEKEFNKEIIENRQRKLLKDFEKIFDLKEHSIVGIKDPYLI